MKIGRNMERQSRRKFLLDSGKRILAIGSLGGLPLLPAFGTSMGGKDSVSRITSFAGGITGAWQIVSMRTIAGEPLTPATHLSILDTADPPGGSESWILRGARSHERYTKRKEHEELAEKSPSLGRPDATLATLIPIRKTDAWWQLSQDERREIFEEQSDHIKIGLNYLPAVARRLYHSRDLGEPFDFLTWFEFTPGNESNFESLLKELRKTKEWTYVEREIVIRLTRTV
jgi:hypothetical protein